LNNFKEREGEREEREKKRINNLKIKF